MDIGDQAARARVADAVKERRRSLRLGQEDVAAAGGPSTATLYQIESRAPKGYSAATIEKLEDVLRWARGSVRAIADGGEPTEVEPSAPNGRGADLARGITPIEVGAHGYLIRMYPNPDASQDEVNDAIQRVVAAVLHQLGELRRDTTDH